MKQSILHVGGHADGEYRAVKLIEMADGGWQLDPGYTLREVPKISAKNWRVARAGDPMCECASITETHYVRDCIRCGDQQFDVYIDYRLRAHDEAALVKTLIAGYRKPKGE